MSAHALTLSRADFADILKMATTGIRSPKTAFSVRLEFAGGMLTAIGPGASGEAPAAGSWPAAVLIDGARAKQLWPRLPTPEPFVVRAENGRFIIGGFSMDASVMDVAPKAVEIVLGGSHREVLVALEKSGKVAVMASLGGHAYSQAIVAHEKAVRAAVRALAPLGVERRDIEAAITASLRRRAGLPPKG